MSTPGQPYLRSSMTILAMVIAAPRSLAAQTLSARPAWVALTVVVPSRLGLQDALTADDHASVRRGASALDVETLVGLTERPASRIEVRLGAGWSAESGRVMVRNRQGEFEALASDASVIAVDAPPSFARGRSPLQFHVAASKSIPAALAIPVEYRITVGASDQIAVWTFPALIRVGADR